MKKANITILMAFMVTVMGGGLWAQPFPEPPSAFEKIQSLVGDWEAPLESGKVIRINYKLMSNNSILVETYRTPSGKETLSIYHLDGKHLLLTHYCAQGNQPRLRYDPAKGDRQRMVFTFLDATNLPSKKKEHMVRLEVRFADADHFEQASTYRAGKEEETTTLKFTRVKGE
jgi:hypothetical protein